MRDTTKGWSAAKRLLSEAVERDRFTHATKLAYRLISTEKLGPDHEYACADVMFDSAGDLDFTSRHARRLIRDRAGWTLPTCPTCAQLIVEALSIRAGKLASVATRLAKWPP